MKTILFTEPKQDDYVVREQFNTLCSNIIFSGHNIKTVAFTSNASGDGKSYISIYTALFFANRGKRVVLVDADLRKSKMAIQHSFKSDDGEMMGLAHYLAGNAKLDDVLYKTNVENFYLIPEGRDVANPLPLLTSSGFQKMIHDLEEEYDFIIIDTPPIGLVVDTAEIGRLTNGVIYVANYKKTRRKELKESKAIFDKAGVPLLGCVLNQVKHRGLASKYYYNHYYYKKNAYQK